MPITTHPTASSRLAPSSPPLRIVQMGPTGPKGGVSAVVTQLSAELARQGHQVLVIGDGANKLKPALEAGASYEEVIYSRRLRVLAAQLGRVRKLLREFEPDVIHVHGRAQALLVRWSGLQPDWFTLHNTHFTEQVSWYDRGALRRFLSPLGRKIFALDPRAIDYLRVHFGVDSERVHIVPNGVDCNAFVPLSEPDRSAARARFRVAPDDVLGVFVGRFHEQKNPQAVIKLAAAAKARGMSALKTIMIGEGPLEGEVRSMIQERGLSDRVQLLGWSDPRIAIQAADVFLMPSRYEGFPLAAVEALACGTPVLRTRTGGVAQMIVEGQTGWGCDPEDDDDFISKSLDVLSRPEDLGKMRAACRKHAVEQLSLSVQAHRTVQAYRS